MRKFIQLTIRANSGNERDVIELLAELKAKKNVVFQNKSKYSADYAKNIFLPESKVACFKTNRKSLFQSKVWMYIKGCEIVVANITSDMNSSLGITNYNFIITAFSRDFLEESVNLNNFEVRLTNENVSIVDDLCEETRRKLLAWEYGCNKSAPITHPMDTERWNDFLISLCRNNETLYVSDLIQWLQEDKHWSSQVSDSLEELAMMYEFGIELLNREAQTR